MKKPEGGRFYRRYADSVVTVHVKEFPVNALVALRGLAAKEVAPDAGRGLAWAGL
jgi:hypothetical protein